MANVQNLKKKLLELIEHNNPLAIALTGEWGIGKTHFWKEFYKNNKDNFVTKKKSNLETNIEENFIAKKYAYVSLFGLDSLDSLKLAIATEVQTTSTDDSILNTDVSTHFKKLFNFVGGGSTGGTAGDIRFGINIGNKLITNIIMSHLKNTLVCLDDIERKSKNLPMSEVMGLVNYLKNERNCQVIMILHDAESEDKVDFEKQKEKVFDEFLVLDESLSIIKDIIEDEKLFPIYEKFYQTLSVKNLRFYQRVQKFLCMIFEKSNSDLSFDSKSQILKSLLVIMLAHDIPSYLDEKTSISFEKFVEIFDKDNMSKYYKLSLPNKNSNKKLTDEQLQTIQESENIESIRARLRPFYEHFAISNWGKVIVTLIRDLDFNKDLADELSIKDLINEKNLKSNRLMHQLLDEYHSLEPMSHFPERFYKMASERVNKDNLNVLSFYCDILKDYGAKDLEAKIIDKIEKYILFEVTKENGKKTLNDWRFSTADPNYRFHDFLSKTIANNNSQTDKLKSYSDIFFDRYKFGGIVDNIENAFKKLDKNILEKIIWMEIEGEQDYRKKFIISIITYPQLNNIDRENIRRWIVELLNDRAIKNKMSRVPIESWLAHTKDLTERLY